MHTRVEVPRRVKETSENFTGVTRILPCSYYFVQHEQNYHQTATTKVKRQRKQRRDNLIKLFRMAAVKATTTYAACFCVEILLSTRRLCLHTSCTRLPHVLPHVQHHRAWTNHRLKSHQPTYLHTFIMVALRNRADHYIFILLFVMVALCNRATITFLPCDFCLLLLLLPFFSSPNLSGQRLDVYHTFTHGMA